MFDSIAQEKLGNQTYKDLLMKENPAHIGTYIFSDGVELNLPSIDDEVQNDNLPPWKKVAG